VRSAYFNDESHKKNLDHAAFEMIGKAFNCRALYQVADKSGRDHMDRILDTPPAKIRETISKIDRLLAASFSAGTLDEVAQEKILQKTQRFRHKFDTIFDAVYSEEIEKMIPEETDSKWMTPSVTIQNFHQKLIAIEEWNQKVLILKLHAKLDQTLEPYYQPERYEQPLKKWNQNQQSIDEWNQKTLISSLYPKLDTLFRAIASHRKYRIEPYRPPSEEWNQETLILKLPTTLHIYIREGSSYASYQPDNYYPLMNNWDRMALIFKLQKKIKSLLDELSWFPKPEYQKKIVRFQRRRSGCFGWLL
jgi:hypothetical protein